MGESNQHPFTRVLDLFGGRTTHKMKGGGDKQKAKMQHYSSV